MSDKHITAYPVPREVEWHGAEFPQQGMTLRDYFAAQILPTLVANDETTWEEDARDAYAIADKMLAERRK